jgi:hypothetical protein
MSNRDVMSNVQNIKTKRTYIKIRMQNIRVTNGHTKELAKRMWLRDI